MADATVMQRAEATAFDLALPIGDGSTVEPWPFATLFLAPVSTGDSHGEGRIPGVESVPPMLRGRGNPGLAVLRLGPFEALLVSETGADFPEKPVSRKIRLSKFRIVWSATISGALRPRRFWRSVARSICTRVPFP